MFTIAISNEGGYRLYTVGIETADSFTPLQDFNEKATAVAFLNYLNGGEGNEKRAQEFMK